MEEPQSSTPSQKTRSCASGAWLRSVLKSHRHHHPTDCTKDSQIPSGRALGRPVAFHSPSVLLKDTLRPREIPSGERRWCAIGWSERKLARAKEDLQKTSREFLRSEPHLHDVDGACQCRSIMRNALDRFPIIDPMFTVEQWSEQIFNWDRMESVLGLAGMTKQLQDAFEPFKVIAQDPLRTLSSSDT